MNEEAKEQKPIAKVTHFFNKINVAVIAVTDDEIKVGDAIIFRGHDNEFTQTVDSLQVEHQNVDALKKGEEGGLKVATPVKVGDLVYRPE
ncbi:MAG: hypothetical protein V1838_05825 [Patescibacteria group bacterium]